MMLYLILFFFVAILGLISLDNRGRLALIIPFVSIFFIMFVGLRYASVDYFNYWYIFDYTNDFSDLAIPNYIPEGGEKPIEALYSFIALVVKALGGGYYIFVFIISAFFLSIKFFVLKNVKLILY